MKTLRYSSIIALAIVALALLVAAPVAMASTITQYTYLASTPTDFTNTNLSPTVNQFNPGLGTLNSVTITLDVNGAAETSVTEDANASGNFQVTEESVVVLDSPDSSLDTAIGGLSEDLNYTSSILSLNPFQSIDLGVVSLTGTPVSENIAAAYLSLFVGGGTLTFDASSLSGFGFIGGGDNQTDSISNDDQGKVTITYDYTPGQPPTVPEPGTLSMFGAGLLGLAGMLRYKFMKSR
jgi:hypothetical protein